MQSLIAIFCHWFLQFELILRLAQLLSLANVSSVNFAYLAGFDAMSFVFQAFPKRIITLYVR